MMTLEKTRIAEYVAANGIAETPTESGLYIISREEGKGNLVKWGDEVELTEGCELTWMRQPHYYMGLYSYSYSASLTIATQVMKRIRKEGQTAVDDWKKTLAAGGTVAPVEFAKMAGVDVTTDAALIDTIDYIGGIIDEIEELNKELN